MWLHDGGRLDAVSAAQSQQHQHHQQVGSDENARNVNSNSSALASVTRRFFSQVDRLFEGSEQDRERALELLRAKEQQVNSRL